MEKMNLPLKQFLTLVGPAQALEVIEEDAAEPVFTGKAAKIRDNEELLDREVKLIEAKAKVTPYHMTYFQIWIY